MVPTGISSVARSPAERGPRLLALAIAVTITLYVIPYGRTIAWPLVLVSTLAHELAHGLMAVVLGGRFEALRLNGDASGVALWSGQFGRLRYRSSSAASRERA